LRFFDTIKNLFPHSKAFQLFVDNNKRKFVKGISKLPENVRSEMELVYGDLFPDSTRYPEKWESVFAIFFKEAELEKRREILDSLWKINQGGQSAVFLEEILQKITPEIRVIENVPIKNPRDGSVIILSINNRKTMVCGNKKAICSFKIGDENYKPSILQNDTSELYSIPDNPLFWETCFFVCSGVERNTNNEIILVNKININIKWKNYIEYFILKLKPLHTTAVLFINWEE